MIRIQDIHSLTDFHRHTKAHVRRLKRTGRPELLTVNGQAELVVQSACAYEKLMQQLQRCRMQKEQYATPIAPALDRAG
jgi:hypothetical protein